MKNIRILLVPAFLAIWGCSHSQINHDLDLLLESAIRYGNDTFKIEGLSLKWDSLLVLHPYTNLNNLKTSLNRNFDKIYNTGIEQRDDICILVFFKDNRVSTFVVESRKTYDFSGLLRNKYYLKDSMFQIVRDTTFNKPRYIIQEK